MTPFRSLLGSTLLTILVAPSAVWVAAAAFAPSTKGFSRSERRCLPTGTSRSTRTPLFSSSNGGSRDADLRRILEASWNARTMGNVPSDPESAAEAAAGSLMNAVNDGQKLLFVDLLLPSYDITQGFNMYDDVSAVEYCIELVKFLEQKALILVRDDKALKSVSRVLGVKERDRMNTLEKEENKDNPDFKDDNEEEKSKETSPSTDTDAFRQQLMSSWEDSSEGDPVESKSPMGSSTPTSNKYRLTSMLGDDGMISAGPDMVQEVVDAVRKHALPKDDEEVIVILSAITREEVVAVRSLVAKYKSIKTIILVNCKFDPMPQELSQAEMVYSILPLVAKPMESDTNIFNKSQKASTADDDKPPTKIVLMRRYPTDWQLFVDANGAGFELAATAPASVTAKNGPPMQWIGEGVKRYLMNKFGKG